MRLTLIVALTAVCLLLLAAPAKACDPVFGVQRFAVGGGCGYAAPVQSFGYGYSQPFVQRSFAVQSYGYSQPFVQPFAVQSFGVNRFAVRGSAFALGGGGAFNARFGPFGRLRSLTVVR